MAAQEDCSVCAVPCVVCPCCWCYMLQQDCCTCWVCNVLVWLNVQAYQQDCTRWVPRVELCFIWPKVLKYLVKHLWLQRLAANQEVLVASLHCALQYCLLRLSDPTAEPALDMRCETTVQGSMCQHTCLNVTVVCIWHTHTPQLPKQKSPCYELLNLSQVTSLGEAVNGQ